MVLRQPNGSQIVKEGMAVVVIGLKAQGTTYAIPFRICRGGGWL